MIDVRTPAEFQHGHIPGAINLPLFSNEERVKVGTTYKQEGREPAILLGFELTGNKWAGFIRQALEFAPARKLIVHCWRGGMRSGAMAWALDMFGFEVHVIQGGYKNYRKWILRQFERDYHLLIIGGMTGCGKTRMLHQLRTLEQQVIDLEDLAQHQGSTYGTLNRMIQPTQEQFENNLGEQLKLLHADKTLWVEDESISIGRLFVPKPFWNQMQQSLLFDLQVKPEQRIQYLLSEYGCLDKDFLVESTERIRKRLGPEQTKNAIAAIRENRMDEFIRLLLVYYDKTYGNWLAKRTAGLIHRVTAVSKDDRENAQQLLQIAQSLPAKGA